MKTLTEYLTYFRVRTAQVRMDKQQIQGVQFLQSFQRVNISHFLTEVKNGSTDHS